MSEDCKILVWKVRFRPEWWIDCAALHWELITAFTRLLNCTLLYARIYMTLLRWGFTGLLKGRHWGILGGYGGGMWVQSLRRCSVKIARPSRLWCGRRRKIAIIIKGCVYHDNIWCVFWHLCFCVKCIGRGLHSHVVMKYKGFCVFNLTQ